MEKAESQALSEVGRLHRKSSLLTGDIKKGERRLKSIQDQIAQEENEIIKLDKDLDKLRVETSKIKTDLATERKENAHERVEISKERDFIKHIEKDLQENTAKANNKAKAADGKTSNAKEQIQILNKVKVGIEVEKKQAADALAKLREESEVRTGFIEKDKKEIDRLWIGLKESQEANRIEKEKLSEVQRAAKENSENLKIRTMELDKKERELMSVSDAIIKKEAAVKKGEEVNKAGRLSNDQERIALSNDRKVIELDQLRFQKLIMEKGVDEELKKLRGESK